MATASRRLLIRVCVVCGEASEPEAVLCRSCSSTQLDWDEPRSGEGCCTGRRLVQPSGQLGPAQDRRGDCGAG